MFHKDGVRIFSAQLPSIQAEGNETTVSLTIIKHSEHTSIGDCTLKKTLSERTPHTFDNLQGMLQVLFGKLTRLLSSLRANE